MSKRARKMRSEIRKEVKRRCTDFFDYAINAPFREKWEITWKIWFGKKKA